MHADSRACSELHRDELIDRVARAMRVTGARLAGMLADTRVPAGQCVLCNSILERTYRVMDTRGTELRKFETERGSAEEAEALEHLKAGTNGVLVAGIRLCRCADHPTVQDAARAVNAERSRPKPAPEQKILPGNFSGVPRY